MKGITTGFEGCRQYRIWENVFIVRGWFEFWLSIYLKYHPEKVLIDI